MKEISIISQTHVKKNPAPLDIPLKVLGIYCLVKEHLQQNKI